MLHPDVYKRTSYDVYTYVHDRNVHTSRISDQGATRLQRRHNAGIAPATDNSLPLTLRDQSLNVFSGGESYDEKERSRQINYENKLLLSKMASIFTKGANSHGGPPTTPRTPHSPRRPATTQTGVPTPPCTARPSVTAGSNQPRRKKEIERMIQDNDALLGRISSVKSTYARAPMIRKEKSRQQHIRQISKFHRRQNNILATTQVRSPNITSSRRVSATASLAATRSPAPPSIQGAITSRPSKLRDSHLGRIRISALSKMITSRSALPAVRSVFTALMLLVCPFDTAGVDITWQTVQQWVEQLGGASKWLVNLKNFKMRLVPISNAAKTLAYLDTEGELTEQLKRTEATAPALMLLRWIIHTAESAIKEPPDTTERLMDQSGRFPQGRVCYRGTSVDPRAVLANEICRRLRHLSERALCSAAPPSNTSDAGLSNLCSGIRKYEVNSADAAGRTSEPFISFAVAGLLLRGGQDRGLDRVSETPKGASINRLSDYGLKLDDFDQLKADFDSADTEGSCNDLAESSDVYEKTGASATDVMATMTEFDRDGGLDLEEYLSSLTFEKDESHWWLGGDDGWWHAVLKGAVGGLQGPSEVYARVHELEGVGGVVEDPSALLLEQCTAVCRELTNESGVKLFDETNEPCSWRDCKWALLELLRQHGSVSAEVVVEVEKAADALLPPLASRGFSVSVPAEFMIAVIGAAEVAAPELHQPLLTGWLGA